MTPEHKQTLLEHGMTAEEIQLITMPISTIQKKAIPYAIMARQKQLDIIEKLNEAWMLANPRKSYLEDEDSTGSSNVLIRVEDGNTKEAKFEL